MNKTLTASLPLPVPVAPRGSEAPVADKRNTRPQPSGTPPQSRGR